MRGQQTFWARVDWEESFWSYFCVILILCYTCNILEHLKDKEGSQGSQWKHATVPKIHLSSLNSDPSDLVRYELTDQVLLAQTPYGPVRRGYAFALANWPPFAPKFLGLCSFFLPFNLYFSLRQRTPKIVVPLLPCGCSLRLALLIWKLFLILFLCYFFEWDRSVMARRERPFGGKTRAKDVFALSSASELL